MLHRGPTILTVLPVKDKRFKGLVKNEMPDVIVLTKDGSRFLLARCTNKSELMEDCELLHESLLGRLSKTFRSWIPSFHSLVLILEIFAYKLVN